MDVNRDSADRTTIAAKTINLQGSLGSASDGLGSSGRTRSGQGRTLQERRGIEPLACCGLVLIDVDRSEGDQPPPQQEHSREGGSQHCDGR
jgi:hypothetical protein